MAFEPREGSFSAEEAAADLVMAERVFVSFD
jgi:hypothetical protein